MIRKINIQNFRGIKDLSLETTDFNVFIGDNGTSKTSILEAINFALSPAFLSNRIKHTDFYNGTDVPIEISLEFDDIITAKLPDGYTSQEVKCNKIQLKIKKREKKSPGKAFSDLVTIEHIILPYFSRDKEGWSIKRKNGTEFKFKENLLTLSQIDADNVYRSFYFSKGREKQIYKGFNTSINAIIDDFNWRFDRAIRKSPKTSKDSDNSESDVISKIEDIENEVHNIIELNKQEVIKKISERIGNFGIDNIDIKLIDAYSPYDNLFLGIKKENVYLPVKYLGSGIEMFYSLIFLETMASFSKEKLVILIDEPELHLHPKLQIALMNYLIEISKKHQIFVTTHSPIFFKNLVGKDRVKTFTTVNQNNSILVEERNLAKGLFPWSPSWGEINYFAYDYPTIEFHDELYGYLQEISEKYKQSEFEKWLIEQGVNEKKKWTLEKDGVAQKVLAVTLPTFIRNKTHHPENTSMKNSNFNDNELKESIEIMLKVLKNINNEL